MCDPPSPLGLFVAVGFAAAFLVVARVAKALKVREVPKPSAVTDSLFVVNNAGGPNPSRVFA